MVPRFIRHTATLSIKLLPLLLLPLLGCARKSFYAETAIADTAVHQRLQEAPASVDSVTVQAGSHYRRGSLYKALWGARHREAWLAPVTVPVLRLDTLKGGLEVEKIGGGMQTISATMVGSEGMTYSLRTVDKRPEVNLPFPLDKSFVADIVLDQTSALHPYAALVVAPLAEAAGIPHATPQLVYARPDEKRLGENKELLSDRLYMLEEKYNDKRALVGELEEAHDIVGTEEMLHNLQSNGNHSVDQLAFAKARLLDLLIGDRDRHEGQWEWAVYKEEEGHVYRPIPEDRDNAFFRFDDGLLSWLLSRKWARRRFVTFHEDYRDVKALMIKSELIDTRAMPEVTAQQFDSLAHVLQRALTDEVIEQAVRRLPGSVYKLDGEGLARKLKSRRDMLDQAAREFYAELAEVVVITGTEEEDRFEVVRLDDGETEVTVRRESDGKVTYRRTFHASETREIALHGLEGNDVFELRGQARKGIKLTIEGGGGRDSVKDTSPMRGRWKSISLRDIESDY